MVVDYEQWANNMLGSGSCNTFGKRMYWRRTRLNMSLLDLARVVKLRTFVLLKIEGDSKWDEFQLLSKHYITANDARTIIDNALTELENEG